MTEKEVGIIVTTNFNTKTVDIDFLDVSGDIESCKSFPVQQALFLAQLLISKSLNIIETEEV